MLSRLGAAQLQDVTPKQLLPLKVDQQITIITYHQVIINQMMQGAFATSETE